jgi:hypothetical protein
MLVKLLCCVCRTPLGRIDTDTIHTPYTTDQFKPLSAGAIQPFPDVLSSPLDWWCPQCLKRPIENERVYTEQGWVWVKKDVVPEMPMQEPPQTEEAKPTSAPEFTCDICGKTFTRRIALTGHKRSHK